MPNELALINAAVCSEENNTQLVHFVDDRNGRKVSSTSGIWEFTSEEFRNRWWKGVSIDSPNVTPLPCRPMTELLDENTPTDLHFFDFWSLDVEGAEAQVLQSTSFEKYHFGVIMIESQGRHPRKELAVRAILAERGYIFIMNEKNSDFYIHPKFAEIYSRTLSIILKFIFL
jgi:hypothetical protein